MEPRQQGLAGGRENAPVSAGGYERIRPSETLVEATPERRGEKQLEVGAVQAEVSQVAMPALPIPVLPTPQAAVSSSSGDDALPALAADDDLIEKEWVDKAKRIIAETKDDPYRREQEINRLQIEYIRRRYGREIGDTGE